MVALCVCPQPALFPVLAVPRLSAHSPSLSLCRTSTSCPPPSCSWTRSRTVVPRIRCVWAQFLAPAQQHSTIHSNSQLPPTQPLYPCPALSANVLQVTAEFRAVAEEITGSEAGGEPSIQFALASDTDEVRPSPLARALRVNPASFVVPCHLCVCVCVSFLVFEGSPLVFCACLRVHQWSERLRHIIGLGRDRDGPKSVRVVVVDVPSGQVRAVLPRASLAWPSLCVCVYARCSHLSPPHPPPPSSSCRSSYGPAPMCPPRLRSQPLWVPCGLALWLVWASRRRCSPCPVPMSST